MAIDKGGRPLKFDESVVQKLEEAFALDCSIPEACFYANISKQTYYNHVNEKAEDGTEEKRLFDRFEALRNKPILMARQTVVKALKDNPDMAMKYLERKLKNEFSTRSEITGKDGKDLLPKPILGGLSKEEDVEHVPSNNSNKENSEVKEES